MEDQPPKNARKSLQGSSGSGFPFPFPFGWAQIEPTSYFFLCLTVATQLTTLWITWDVWQHRGLSFAVPNLPWYGAPPQFNFGWLLVASLFLVLLSPRYWGTLVHIALLIAAICCDQLRCQPQILSVAVLMVACVYPSARKIGVWFLITMWLWAGIHKLLSPDWTGEVSYYMLLQLKSDGDGFRVSDYHAIFAWFGTCAEIGLGLLAWRRPKVAAFGCIAMHLGITMFLIVINWNFSVLPWNLCTAAVGAWLLWNVEEEGKPVSFPQSLPAKISVALLLLTPIGFYFGMVRHSLCHVLYSGNVPDAIISNAEGSEICVAFDTLRVPFPHERKAYLDLFELTGQPGDKLHIREYRRLLKSGYFEISKTGNAVEISVDEFFSTVDGAIEAVAHDDRRKRYLLAKHFYRGKKGLKEGATNIGTIKVPKAGGMVWAIVFDPQYFEPSVLEHLDGLPNLEQVQLGDCGIENDDLKYLSGLRHLQGVGLNRTRITDAGLVHLKDLPMLSYIEFIGTEITPEAAAEITK